uniref:Uncharacterized protein n=1 Tax=Meloidogyne enterolobii TaxID=390850 RepID=A0A6V7XLS5_MELEN|nr:unnamed protein product [Meloidogyne enterolobii]CAD2199827.1 unnamed protein product [Meloidogyne enterolobii]
MFVGHILLVSYLLSICFIQIAASNDNESGKEEIISPIIIVGILVLLGICVGSIIGYFYVRHNRKKSDEDEDDEEFNSNNFSRIYFAEWKEGLHNELTRSVRHSEKEG